MAAEADCRWGVLSHGESAGATKAVVEGAAWSGVSAIEDTRRGALEAGAGSGIRENGRGVRTGSGEGGAGATKDGYGKLEGCVETGL